MEYRLIKVRDFSLTPGTRDRDEGTKSNSGQEYREAILEPAFKDAIKDNYGLEIDLDYTVGYGTSWLEEVFGGLTRLFGKEEVLNRLKFKSDEEPYLIEDIKEYIDEAEPSDC